jgi:hypothetical protein
MNVLWTSGQIFEMFITMMLLENIVFLNKAILFHPPKGYFHMMIKISTLKDNINLSKHIQEYKSTSVIQLITNSP